MSTLLLYVLVTSALYYLGADANITYPVRSRLPDAVNRFLLCPACSGFWYGFAIGTYGALRGWSFLGLAPGEAQVAAGLGAMIWTPLVAALHLQALGAVHREHAPSLDVDVGMDDGPHTS